MEVYTTEEVAEKLNIHTTTVLKLINKEELPAKKVARKWRITENQLKIYLEGNKMNVKQSSTNQVKQYLKDIEETVKKMEKENKEEIRSFQAESIQTRIEFIKNQLKNLEE